MTNLSLANIASIQLVFGSMMQNQSLVSVIEQLTAVGCTSKNIRCRDGRVERGGGDEDWAIVN